MAEVDDWITPETDDWIAPGESGAQPPEPADHGYSERAKLSPVGKALTPFTTYWPTYKRMQNEAYEQTVHGLKQLAHPGSQESSALWDLGAGALNTAAGGFNTMLGSPFNAAYRTFLGQPVEDVTGIPREYTDFAAQLATPGLGFTKMPKAPGAPAQVLPKIKPIEGADLTSPEAEANRALAREFDINLTRGQATRDSGAIRREDMASRGSYGDDQQKIAQPKFEDQFQEIQDAGQRVGQQLSRGEGPLGTPADAGSALNTEIADRAAAARAERDSALQRAEQGLTQQREQADQALAAQRGEAEQGVAQQRQTAEETGRAISERIVREHPEIEHPLDAAEMVGERVRETAAQDRDAYRSSYREAYSRPGEFRRDRFTGLGDRIRNEMTLSDNPMIVDELTPAANGALNHLDNVSNLRLVNRADPRAPPNPDEIAAINLQGLDRARKVLQSYYRRAATPTDRAATSRIISEFDGQVERAITEGLFSGDPRALEALQRARSQFRQYQQTYHPQQAGDEVGTAMRRIVERNATPEQISNMILGSGQIGATGLPVQIAGRLQQVLGPESREWNAVQQAMWQKASQVRTLAGDIDLLRSARNIDVFARSTLGRRMFPEELAAMRNHAEGLRRLKAAEDNLPQAQKAAQAANTEATKAAQAAHNEATATAQNAYEAAFGGGDLTGAQRGVFQRIAEGTATPEETANTMFSIIGAGNPGNAVRALTAIERIVGADSPTMGAVRQGVWQKLTQTAYGKDQPGQQKIVQAVNEFLNGKGRTIARQLYSEEERALMNRYAEAVRRTIIPKYARTNSDTAVAVAAQRSRAAATAASAVTSMLHLGPIGHLGGHYVSKLLAKRFKSVGAEADLRSLGESLDDTIPKSQLQLPAPKSPRTFRPVPFAGATGNNRGSP